MTLRRVRPPGWPVNGRLSSAEVSALDAQVARALDKSREGDTLEGIIEVAPTGGVYLEGGAFVEASAGGVLRTSGGAALLRFWRPTTTKAPLSFVPVCLRGSSLSSPR